MKKYLVLSLVFSALASGDISAQDCSNYQYDPGILVIENPDGLMIVSTEEVAAEGSSSAEILEARREADILARASLSSFFNQTVADESSLNTASINIKAATTAGAANQKATGTTSVKEKLRAIRTSTKSLLRGVRVIADCYSKSSGLVRVSVHIKTTVFKSGEMETINEKGSGKVRPGASEEGIDTPGYSRTRNAPPDLAPPESERLR